MILSGWTGYQWDTAQILFLGVTLPLSLVIVGTAIWLVREVKRCAVFPTQLTKPSVPDSDGSPNREQERLSPGLIASIADVRKREP